jgi:hypothetical protein
MTLILTLNGKESIWMLADRRLSFEGRQPKDDARKLMFLETGDAVAIIGYAGLGATALGTEPADWMSAVLRGHNRPLEECLGVLARAAREQLPRHLARLPSDLAAHHVLVTAFVSDEARFYSIDLVLEPDKRNCRFRYTRHLNTSAPRGRVPRIGLAGSGSVYLATDRRWVRPLLRVLGAYETGRASHDAVCNHLAKLNLGVHNNTRDGSVGPRCIVAWRNKNSGRYKGGGGHQFLTSAARDKDTHSLPTIGNGMDIVGIVNALMPDTRKTLNALLAGEPAEEADTDMMNKLLAGVPHKPDEKLR